MKIVNYIGLHETAGIICVSNSIYKGKTNSSLERFYCNMKRPRITNVFSTEPFDGNEDRFIWHFDDVQYNLYG